MAAPRYTHVCWEAGCVTTTEQKEHLGRRPLSCLAYTCLVAAHAGEPDQRMQVQIPRRVSQDRSVQCEGAGRRNHPRIGHRVRSSTSRIGAKSSSNVQRDSLCSRVWHTRILRCKGCPAPTISGTNSQQVGGGIRGRGVLGRLYIQTGLGKGNPCVCVNPDKDHADGYGRLRDAARGFGRLGLGLKDK
jgi:hypothetical protein